MRSESSQRPRIAVIGAGISGLSAAHRLLELMPTCQLTVFESSDRVGGVIRTEQCGDYLIEHGADMFTTKESSGVNLCRRLGIESELIGTNKKDARAFVVHQGELIPVPDGFALMTPGKAWPIVMTPLLSVRAKMRMAWEYFVPAKLSGEDESLADFVTRRLGREAYERLVQPLIGGIYTADPTKLSMQAALPQFVEMEQQHGGLLRSIARSRSRKETGEQGTGARYGMFVTPRHGMQSMLDALVARLPANSIEFSTPVTALHRLESAGWSITAGKSESRRDFDAAIVAVPSHRVAQLLDLSIPELAARVREIPYASASIVVLAYRREQIRHPLNGFGVVVPQKENRRILAASLASVKFPGRAPADRVLIRVFIGGACQPELAELPDGEIEHLARQELHELLGVQGAPELSRIIRWRQAMPQYHVGHLERIALIEQQMQNYRDLALAGNAYHGVGIPFCIRSGELAAEKIRDHFSSL